jgi:hypothetical protein
MQTPSAKIDWLSIGQLGLGVLSCLICFGLAAGLVFLGTSSNALNANFNVNSAGMFMLAGLLTAIGLLNIPSIVFATRALNGKSGESPIKTDPFRLASIALISLPIWLAGGQYLVQTSFATVLLPFFNVLALLIPIWWMVEFGRRKLPSGSPQRSWGLVSVGLGLIPILTIMVETLVAILMVLAVFARLGTDPVWMGKFNQLFLQFSQSDYDPAFLSTLLKDLLSNPLVITAIFASMGLLMPLIEEFFKPLALWTLRRRMQTPADGFSAGLVAGACFALIESAALITQIGAGAEWSQMVLLRIATSLLHMTTSALVGWGLVSGWTVKKCGRTILSILAATAIHGLWNSLVLSMALLPMIGSLGGQSPLVHFFSGFGTYSFAILLTFLAIFLYVMNHRLQRESNKANSATV